MPVTARAEPMPLPPAHRPLTEADYEAIEAAVVETNRLRWFFCGIFSAARTIHRQPNNVYEVTVSSRRYKTKHMNEPKKDHQRTKEDNEKQKHKIKKQPKIKIKKK